MMITWRGKNCSDGCPFYVPEVWHDGVRITRPLCGVDGYKDVGPGMVFDIRLKVEGEGSESYTPRPKECPFEDVHGLPLEVHNVD